MAPLSLLTDVMPSRRHRRDVGARATAPTVILMYHRIGAPDDDPLQLFVSPENFRAQMEVLREAAPVVGFDALDTPATAPRVLVTFDDGYLDNLEHAVPVLEELGIPATFFVTTAALDPGAPDFWWDRLEHLVRTDDAPAVGSVVVAHPDGRRIHVDVRTPAGRRRCYVLANDILVLAAPAAQEAFLADLADQLGRVADGRATHGRMNAAQLRALHDGGLITIGAHTRHHYCLASLDEAAARAEIAGCRDDLAEVLGTAPALLAYPYGAPGTIDERHDAIAAEAGYSWACTTRRAAWFGEGSARALPRVAVFDVGPDEFRARLAEVGV